MDGSIGGGSSYLRPTVNPWSVVIRVREPPLSELDDLFNAGQYTIVLWPSPFCFLSVGQIYSPPPNRTTPDRKSNFT